MRAGRLGRGLVIGGSLAVAALAPLLAATEATRHVLSIQTVYPPKDGYTWASGAPHDLGAYKVLGMLDTTIQDWHLFIAAATGTFRRWSARSASRRC